MASPLAARRPSNTVTSTFRRFGAREARCNFGRCLSCRAAANRGDDGCTCSVDAGSDCFDLGATRADHRRAAPRTVPATFEHHDAYRRPRSCRYTFSRPYFGGHTGCRDGGSCGIWRRARCLCVSSRGRCGFRRSRAHVGQCCARACAHARNGCTRAVVAASAHGAKRANAVRSDASPGPEEEAPDDEEG